MINENVFNFIERLNEEQDKFKELNTLYTIDEENDCFDWNDDGINDTFPSIGINYRQTYVEILTRIHDMTQQEINECGHSRFALNMKEQGPTKIANDIKYLEETYKELDALYQKAKTKCNWIKDLDVILNLDSEYYESSRCW